MGAGRGLGDKFLQRLQVKTIVVSLRLLNWGTWNRKWETDKVKQRNRNRESKTGIGTIYRYLVASLSVCICYSRNWNINRETEIGFGKIWRKGVVWLKLSKLLSFNSSLQEFRFRWPMPDSIVHFPVSLSFLELLLESYIFRFCKYIFIFRVSSQRVCTL